MSDGERRTKTPQTVYQTREIGVHPFEHNRLDETSIVEGHRCPMAAKFGCLLMSTIASFLRYTGYLNFINGPISRVLLLILVHVQLLSCLFF